MTKMLCFNCGRPGHREKECRVVMVVLSVKPDTTLVSGINRMLSSLVTSRQLKRNLYLPSYHWKYKVPSYNTRIVPSRVNEVKKQSLPLYEVTVKALNGRE